MKIQAIYIACFKHDVRFTRILVASIRCWYPEISICLIKDLFYGDFDTSDIETSWHVSVLPLQQRRFGWGFIKLEPLFLSNCQRCLILDSDIVFAGPVLELIEQEEADFVVQHEEPSPSFVESHYFDSVRLRDLDPVFQFPGFTFNTGQLVATTGILTRSDFEAFVEAGDPPLLRHPEIFKLGEQGLLNYVLMRKQQVAALTLKRLRFMEVPESEVEGATSKQDLQLSLLTPASPYRFLIHWCGLKMPRLEDMNRADLLLYFEARYYRQLHFGKLRRAWRLLAAQWRNAARAKLAGSFIHRWVRTRKAIQRSTHNTLQGESRAA